MKECRICHVLKPLSDFYTDPKAADRHGYYCKVCNRLRARNYYSTPEYREHHKEWYEYWIQKNRQSNNARKLRNYYRHREEILLLNKTRYSIKKKARKTVEAAVRCGKLVPAKICERCGQSKKTNAHHPDYSKKLVVQWLCTRCHGIVHSKFQS